MRFVFLLASGLLLSSPASPAPSPTTIKPGTVTLAVSPDFTSSLGIDLNQFTEALCPGDLPKGGPTGRIDCGTSVPDTRADPVEGILSAHSLELAELTPVSLELTELDLRSREPFLSPCGAFAFRVALDPRVEQPRSELILAPEGGAPHGVFSGILNAALILRFEAVADGRIVDVATTIQIPVAGPYALADRRVSSPASNVTLLVRREGDAWAAAVSCAPLVRPCPALCLTASKNTLEALRPPS